jgi:hypothetical protein
VGGGGRCTERETWERGGGEGGEQRRGKDEGEWVYNRVVGLRDFELLGREMEYLTEIGYCLNHDAMYVYTHTHSLSMYIYDNI